MVSSKCEPYMLSLSCSRRKLLCTHTHALTLALTHSLSHLHRRTLDRLLHAGCCADKLERITISTEGTETHSTYSHSTPALPRPHTTTTTTTTTTTARTHKGACALRHAGTHSGARKRTQARMLARAGGSPYGSANPIDTDSSQSAALVGPSALCSCDGHVWADVASAAALLPTACLL